MSKNNNLNLAKELGVKNWKSYALTIIAIVLLNLLLIFAGLLWHNANAYYNQKIEAQFKQNSLSYIVNIKEDIFNYNDLIEKLVGAQKKLNGTEENPQVILRTKALNGTEDLAIFLMGNEQILLEECNLLLPKFLSSGDKGKVFLSEKSKLEYERVTGKLLNIGDTVTLSYGMQAIAKQEFLYGGLADGNSFLYADSVDGNLINDKIYAVNANIEYLNKDSFNNRKAEIIGNENSLKSSFDGQEVSNNLVLSFNDSINDIVGIIVFIVLFGLSFAGISAIFMLYSKKIKNGRNFDASLEDKNLKNNNLSKALAIQIAVAILISLAASSVLILAFVPLIGSLMNLSSNTAFIAIAEYPWWMPFVTTIMLYLSFILCRIITKLKLKKSFN